MGKINQRVLSGLCYGIFQAIGKLPLRVSYPLADLLAWLARDVVRYRRRVVHDNIFNSFPELSDEERLKIERDFYNFLADYFVETLHLAGMKPEEMKRHMLFKGLDQIDEAFARGQSVIFYLGHYCNWEWVSSLPLQLPPEIVAGQIYHPLENKVADDIFLRLRAKFGAKNVPMARTLRSILEWQREGKRSITGFIADQGPTMESIHLFVDFLNQDTPVLTGGERIARKLKAAVFYCDIERVHRGEYEARIIKIADDASTTDEFYVTRKYFELLEKSIRRQPAFWLWSHRRWKRTRSQFEQLYGAETVQRLSHL